MTKKDWAALRREMEAYAAKNHISIIAGAPREILRRAVAEDAPRRILEIGTAIGYSAMQMADASPLPEVEIVTIELIAKRFAAASDFIARSPFADNIDARLGDAGNLLAQMAVSEEKFDFVFLDAAKGQYAKYFRQFAPLLWERATVVADDVLFQGLVLADDTVPHRRRSMVMGLRKYISFVNSLPDWETKIYGSGDGIAVSRRV